MRTNPRGNDNIFNCPKCEVSFNCENDLKAHMTKHSTSPPQKRQRNDSALTTSAKDRQKNAMVENLDEAMGDLNDPEVESQQVPLNKSVEVLENLDEEMGDLRDLKDPELKEPSGVKEPDRGFPVSNETGECFELIFFNKFL